MRNIFAKLFNPPSYLKMPSVGVDISDRSIRFIEFREDYLGNKRLARYGLKDIEAGIISNGKVLDREKLIKILNQIKKDYKLSFVRASIPEEQVYLFSIQIPKVKENNIRETIELLLEEHVPIPANEIVFDYQIISELENNYNIEVTAVSTKIVEDYAVIFEEAGLTLVGFELEAQSITRSIIKTGDSGTYMVVDYGNTRTGLSFVVDGIVRFASSVDIGSSMQDKELSRALSLDVKTIEELKKKNGLLKTNKDEAFFQAILSETALLRDEINKHFIYWHTHKDDFGEVRPPVDKILLCGGNANLIGLPEYLSSSLRVPVMHSDVWINITNRTKYIPPLERGPALSYPTAIGLALAEDNSLVNLLPLNFQKTLKKILFLRFANLFVISLSASFLLGTILLIPTYIIGNERLLDLESKISLQDKTQLNQQESIVLTDTEDIVSKLKIFPDGDIQNNSFVSEVIIPITEKSKNTVNINSILYEYRTNKEDINIKISGKASTRNILATFEQNLNKSELFKKVNLPISNFVKGKDIDFTIDGLIAYE